MKRVFILILFLMVILVGVSSENLQPTAIPVNPYLAGQGGSFTANAHGYNSLFKNPAGFAMADGDFTLLSANVWGFVDKTLLDFASSPTAAAEHYAVVADQIANITEADIAEWAADQTEESIIQLLEDAGFDASLYEADPEAFLEQEVADLLADIGDASSPEEILTNDSFIPYVNLANAVVEDITGTKLMPSGNIRIGANIGLLGIVGGGLGLGVNINMDSWLTGMTILDATGYAALTASATAGLGFEIIPDFLTIGADVRPLYRVYVPLSGKQALEMASDTENIMETINTYAALGGWGFGFDVGTIIQLGDLNIGVTVTDLFGTRLAFQNYSVGAIMASLESGSTLEATDAEGVYVIPMDILLGVSYMFDFDVLGDLTLHAEISKALSGIQAVAQGEEFDVLSVLHAGAYLNLFDFIGVMAGYNEGYLSAGAGFKLLILDISAAAFLKANGENIGYSDFGATVEAAIRF